MNEYERNASSLRAVRDRAGAEGYSASDRLFAATSRWLSGCQNQLHAIWGVCDELRAGEYRGKQVIPDAVALSRNFVRDVVETWETLFYGEAPNPPPAGRKQEGSRR